MTTIKSYTDLNQSKKLAEVLPHNTADNTWERVTIAGSNLNVPEEQQYVHNGNMPFYYYSGIGIPCWSLAALIGILPIDYIGHKHYFLEISKMGDNAKPYEVRYFRFKKDWEGANFGRITHISCSSDNLIDACYDMIITLHNKKLL